MAWIRWSLTAPPITIRDASALYTVTFDGEEMDDISIHALHQIEDMLSDYDLYVDTSVGVDSSADLAAEMGSILAIAAIIIVLVLTLTSRSYAEVPVLMLTFGAAALLNKGHQLCFRHNFVYFQFGDGDSAAGVGH